MLNISEWNPSILLKEIRSRIEMAKKVFMEKKKLVIDKMNLELKKRIMKCLVFSVTMYAAETWTLTQTKDQKPLKCGYGEEWKRSAVLIKLLMRKFSGE